MAIPLCLFEAVDSGWMGRFFDLNRQKRLRLGPFRMDFLKNVCLNFFFEISVC